MEVYLLSMAVIAIVAILAPVVASLIPNKPVPEVVFLLAAGAVLGPHMLGIIAVDGPIALFSELGLAFLFLLAGYEIDPKELKSERGKAALGTWFVSFFLALLIVTFVTKSTYDNKGSLAVAIAMTSTALGTLLPILKERGLLETSIGKTVLAHGTFGEVMPILAMAILLSVRATWETIIILLVFLVIAVATAVFPKKAERFGAFMSSFLNKTADTTAQTTMRATVALLVGLVTIAALFKLDIVLGAFAAGFILNYMTPEDNRNLEEKLDGIAYGFFIPLFFIVSGAGIDVTAVTDNPMLLVGFVIALLLVRAIPVYVSTYIPKEDRENMTTRYRLTSALYSTTALPIIVAVTHLAISVDVMSESTASVLVSAGAITVLVMPILTSITCNIADAHPLQTAQEIASNPADAWSVLRDHWSAARESDREYRALRKQVVNSDNMRERARNKASAERERLRMLQEGIDAMHATTPTTPSVGEDLAEYEYMVSGVTLEQLREFISSRDRFLETVMRQRWSALKCDRDDLACLTWPELKKKGDERWEFLKSQGDNVWDSMKEQGDKRWAIIKAQGDREWERRLAREARANARSAATGASGASGASGAEGQAKDAKATASKEREGSRATERATERKEAREARKEARDQRTEQHTQQREEIKTKVERPVVERPVVEKPQIDAAALKEELKWSRKGHEAEKKEPEHQE